MLVQSHVSCLSVVGVVMWDKGRQELLCCPAMRAGYTRSADYHNALRKCSPSRRTSSLSPPDLLSSQCTPSLDTACPLFKTCSEFCCNRQQPNPPMEPDKNKWLNLTRTCNIYNEKSLEESEAGWQWVWGDSGWQWEAALELSGLSVSVSHNGSTVIRSYLHHLLRQLSESTGFFF